MEFTEVIAGRESVRKYDGRKPSEEQLLQILEAGRLAPTAYNKQPQRVFILESEEALAKMDSVHPCRYGAAVVLLVCGDKSVSAGNGSDSTALIDATIAATHMLLAAHNAGVDSVWAGVHQPEETREVFGLSEDMIPVCFIDLGFRPTDSDRNNSARAQRNPLDMMIKRL
ncbi:MAG: nitroreductase [Anaerofustis stercorihominis]|nr:nitroreductase [Anaerofustis stercorihominis]